MVECAAPAGRMSPRSGTRLARDVPCLSHRVEVRGMGVRTVKETDTAVLFAVSHRRGIAWCAAQPTAAMTITTEADETAPTA